MEKLKVKESVLSNNLTQFRTMFYTLCFIMIICSIIGILYLINNNSISLVTLFTVIMVVVFAVIVIMILNRNFGIAYQALEMRLLEKVQSISKISEAYEASLKKFVNAST